MKTSLIRCMIASVTGALIGSFLISLEFFAIVLAGLSVFGVIATTVALMIKYILNENNLRD